MSVELLILLSTIGGFAIGFLWGAHWGQKHAQSVARVNAMLDLAEQQAKDAAKKL